MRVHLLLILLGALACGALWSQEAPTPNPEEAARTAKLVELLGSEDFEEREGARAHLVQMGEAARKELTRYANGNAKLEARNRAKLMLSALNRKVYFDLLSESERKLADAFNPFMPVDEQDDFQGWLCTGDETYPYILMVQDARICIEGIDPSFFNSLPRKANGWQVYKLGMVKVSVGEGTLVVNGVEVPTNQGKRLVIIDKTGKVDRLTPTGPPKKK